MGRVVPGRVALALGFALVAAAAGYASAELMSARAPSGAALRAEVTADFAHLGSSSTAAALAPYVQGVDPALIGAIARGQEGDVGRDLPASLPGRFTVSAIHETGDVATVDFWQQTAWARESFVGTVVAEGSRWKITWTTVCVLVEQEAVLCPNPPAGVVSPVPVPYSVNERVSAVGALGLLNPGSLAVATNGDLLIADTGRDQILAITPAGQLRVFAGDGSVGSSGDGGPATLAELSLRYEPEIAVAPDGAVFVPDAGNCRLQVVEPNGPRRRPTPPAWAPACTTPTAPGGPASSRTSADPISARATWWLRRSPRARTASRAP